MVKQLKTEPIYLPLIRLSFLTNFFSTFTQAYDILPDFNTTRGDSPQLVQPIITEQVYQALLKPDPHKASGPDGIPTLVLKQCCKELSPSIYDLFNRSLSSGRFPQQ